MKTDVGNEKSRKRRKQLLNDLRKRRRYWELQEEANIEKDGNDSLSHESKEELQVIFSTVAESFVEMFYYYGIHLLSSFLM